MGIGMGVVRCGPFPSCVDTRVPIQHTSGRMSGPCCKRLQCYAARSTSVNLCPHRRWPRRMPMSRRVINSRPTSVADALLRLGAPSYSQGMRRAGPSRLQKFIRATEAGRRTPVMGKVVSYWSRGVAALTMKFRIERPGRQKIAVEAAHWMTRQLSEQIYSAPLASGAGSAP
jgi:hypothetical protein